MFKITHACGHALTTSGKQSPDGYKEWSYTNEIVKLVMAELDQYEEVSQRRIDDPTGKTDYPLVVRSNMVNSFNPTLHIDYHMNAFGTGWTTPGGTEVFVYKLTLKEAFAIASKIQGNLVKELCFANRGVKAGDLHMLRETNPAAILIEVAFMSNQNEAMKMRTVEYQQKAAKAIVDGLVAQYELKKKVVAPVMDKTPYKVIVPNTAFWQVKGLIPTYMDRGYKCYGEPQSGYDTEYPKDNDPWPFVIETNLSYANQLINEFNRLGYDRVFVEEIK